LVFRSNTEQDGYSVTNVSPVRTGIVCGRW
jgi:hypothetical protein